jgi:thioredoxin reductase (NADPH)
LPKARYCPVCDGYEAADQRIGILGHGEDASSKARFLRTYSNDVTLLSLDERGSGNTETARSLRDAGIKVAGPVRAIEQSADGMRAVLRGGKAMLFDVIYPALGCGVRSELASALGAKTNDVGCLEVDSARTSAYFSVRKGRPLLSLRGNSISTRCILSALETQQSEHETAARP